MERVSSSRPFFQSIDSPPEEKVGIYNECGWFSKCDMSFSDNSTHQYSDSSVHISNSGNTTTTTTTQTDSRRTNYQLYSGNTDSSSKDFRPYSGNQVDYRPNSGNPITTNTDNGRTSNQPVLIPVPAWVRNLPAAQNQNGQAAIGWGNPVPTQSPNAEIGNGTATNNGGDAALPIIEEDLLPVQPSPSTATGSTPAGQSLFLLEDGRVR